MKKPDFIIPGVARSGTSSLSSYLSQHPDICFSYIKEPNFFSYYYDKGNDWYLGLFHPSIHNSFIKKFANLVKTYSKRNYSQNKSIWGEASTTYFTYPKAPKRMYEFNPNFKLIFTLRNPVERAYSNYKRDVQILGLQESFERIIKTDIESDKYTERFYSSIGNFESFNYKNSSEYLERGKYYTHIKRFLDYFPKEQMYFLIFEKYIKNPQEELVKILKFLDVHPDFKFDAKYINRNPSLMPNSVRLQQLTYKLFYPDLRESALKQGIKFVIRNILNYFNHINLFHKTNEMPMMEESTRKYLTEYYRNEISNLENLLDIELSEWKV